MLELVQRIKLTSATQNIDFTSIPSDGQDLKLLAYVKPTTNIDDFTIQINTDTAGSYRYFNFTTSSDSNQTLTSPGALRGSSRWGTIECDFFNYADSGKATATFFQGGVAGDSSGNNRGKWGGFQSTTSNTMSSLRVATTSGSFDVGSEFLLYKTK